jgi:hypothetical protein
MGKRWHREKSRLFIGWLSLFVLVAAANDALALDFSAERIVKNGKKVVMAHINAKDDRWRFEFAQPQGGASIIIVRMDRQSSWLILSRRRQYLETPIADEHRLMVSETMEGELSREFVGDQMLNGYPTELFDVTVAVNGETRRYYQWVTKVQRFPVKTVSKEGSWSEEFRQVIFTKQSPFLFELPQRLDRANPSVETQQ